MTDLTLYDIDEEIAQELAVRAAGNGRSVPEGSLRNLAGRSAACGAAAEPGSRHPCKSCSAGRRRVGAAGTHPAPPAANIRLITMVILDTNVVSELMRPRPEPRVDAWPASQNSSEVFLTVITEAELLYGMNIMPGGKRKDSLRSAIDRLLTRDFRGRILSLESPAAAAYARLTAARRSTGRQIAEFDGPIAAITAAHQATLATRNTSDFQGCGIALINPWHP